MIEGFSVSYKSTARAIADYIVFASLDGCLCMSERRAEDEMTE